MTAPIEFVSDVQTTLPARALATYIRKECAAGRIVIVGPDGMTAAEIAAHIFMWCLLGQKAKGPEVTILARPNPEA